MSVSVVQNMTLARTRAVAKERKASGHIGEQIGCRDDKMTGWRNEEEEGCKNDF